MLWEIAKSLSASSPLTAALNEARRMAKRHLEKGGAATAPGADLNRPGFVVPPDIEPASITSAIEAKLRDQRTLSRLIAAASQVLELDKDGRLIVPAELIQNLGDGDEEYGRRLLERIIADIRNRRILQTTKLQSEGP